eukprot:CAMPEP_0118700094 /NCGR_PEP_ID=MMETSP0800-20121206/16353_1 /TAXON_ID=210618 ORGANISM="Striatella unipunctata, Strain CCMP2910" /NCGR_SAMPLE_ID=MMETSP0800 /ASSEMBLY_ACC=CAM_ASM_000638 /LENGTH=299 /DNA_ID=CAMNT_0006600563 /DNA_START=358 /DNA_END=1258 /DNA_ORIENTATION=+
MDVGDGWFDSSSLRVQDYHSGVKILKATYNPTSKGSQRITKSYFFDKTDKATLSFDVKFHSRFEWVKGGKMHGLGGGSRTTGCNDITPDGWSVRMVWRQNGRPELYVYHQDRVNRCGDSKEADFNFSVGKWYRIDMYIEMNSAADAADGLAELYINGIRYVRYDELRLTGNMDVLIDSFMFSSFYGGGDTTWSPSKDTYVYYDNFQVHPAKRISGEKGKQCEIFMNGIARSQAQKLIAARNRVDLAVGLAALNLTVELQHVALERSMVLEPSVLQYHLPHVSTIDLTRDDIVMMSAFHE